MMEDDNPGKGKNLEKTSLKSSSPISPDGHSALNPLYMRRRVAGENLSSKNFDFCVLNVNNGSHPVSSDKAFMSVGL